jgi:DNA-binding CsgD family transcriptional regulator
MRPLGAVDEIIERIYEGPLESKPWRSFLHELRLRMDCDVAAMSLRPANAGFIPLILWDRRQPLTDSQAEQARIDYARLADVDPLGNALRRPGDIYTLDEVIDRRELVRTPFYQTVMQPCGVDYQLGMYFAEPGGWQCHVGIMNGPERGDFGPDHKAFFVGLRPHLERALRMHARLKRSELEKQVYGEALERLTIGTIILDGRGEVIEISAAARAILQKHAGISVATGRVMLSSPHDATRLNRLIAQALELRVDPNAEMFVKALRIDSDPAAALGLLIRAVPPPAWYQSEASPSVIVYVRRLDQSQLAPEEVVAQLFGLTHSEALLATLLADGLTLAEAAQKLKLTDSSVRTYSKTIYAKTGVNRQAELVRLVLKSVALLA